jgi:hypothetical protein
MLIVLLYHLWYIFLMARRKSRPMTHCLKRPAPRLARLLRRVADHERLDDQLQSCLPDELRGYCHLAGWREGNVLLHVDSAAWATRLRYALPELTACCALLRDADKVRVKVRPVQGSPKVVRRRPNSLSEDAARLLLDCSHHLGDSSLSESLRRLARHAGHSKSVRSVKSGT